MPFAQLALLLPCHSLEDFPVHHEGEFAEGLLAAWSALWHPALIASVGALPIWYRADAPPDDLKDSLIVVPEASESLIEPSWHERARSEGALLVRKTHRRDALISAIWQLADAPPPPLDAELVADFIALGTGYLLVELLTRQMRYMSNIDEIRLRDEVVAAAKAAVEGREEPARDGLRRAFEMLMESRERFYPVEAFMVDVVLTAPTTIGSALARELRVDLPKNLLISGELLEQLAAEQPDTLRAIESALDRSMLSVIGGEHVEGELPLLPLEQVLANFQRGRAAHERVLKRAPTVYARRRHGLSPALPQLLSRQGFAGALHATLDDGQFPLATQCKMRWEGLDGSSLDALFRVPLPADKPESMLTLPQKLGESMDMDHVATIVFARWPGCASDYFRDLQRMAEYVPALGRFITLEAYFDQTDSPGDMSRPKADQYRAPYLRQAVIREQPDPLSRIAQAHRASRERCAREFADLIRVVYGGTKTIAAQTVGEALSAAAGTLGAALARGGAQAQGAVVFNPESFARRLVVDVSQMSAPPDVAGPVIAVQTDGASAQAVVDVPGCGLAWLTPGSGAPPKRGLFGKKPQPIAEETRLSNEHLTATIDPITGGLRSLFTPNVRGNRLSQQLSFRLPAPRPKPGEPWRDPDAETPYSIMAADSVSITRNGAALGEILARGRLVSPEGKVLARFTQTYRLGRGSRVLDMDVSLELEESPRADPWNSYYAARFAWPHEMDELRRGVSLSPQSTTAKRVEAPEYICIGADETAVTLLTGGLPYHRYNGFRMLDTLLCVKGDASRSWRLGVGVDLPCPALAAMSLISPPSAGVPCAVPNESGNRWVFHVDLRSVLATGWQGVWDGERLTGFRVRLLETAARRGRLTLRAPRAVAAARQIDFRGETLVELRVEGDAVTADIGPSEWLEIEARFA